jgi:alpha-mannosidase
LTERATEQTAAEGGRSVDRRASARTLHLIGNSHIDPVWLWQWPEGFQEIRATFRSALDRMDEYPEFIFTCDSAAYYEWIEQIDPQMFSEIRERVAEGRWEIVGGWWVEPDCNIPSGESFVRQALISQLYFQERFGRIATVGYNVDPFGHHAMLPQLLRRSGMDSYIFMRPGPHELPLPAPLFWWESPDGSRVLAYRLPHEYCSSHEDLGLHLDKSIAQLPQRWTEMMAFYGVGNHGGGPTRANLDSIRRLDGAGSMPRLLHSTPRRFFDTAVADGATIPVYGQELQHHAVGCYSAHSGVKRWMRRAENALASAEVWAVLSESLAGHAYPSADLRHAWKGVLFNQFHDTLGGTAIEPAYQDARDQLGEALAIAGRVQNVAIQSISRMIDIPVEDATIPIVVFNPHPWPVDGGVELEYGGLRSSDGLLDETGAPVAFQPIQSYATVLPWRTRIAFEASVPALGYRTYLMKAERPRVRETPLRAHGTTVENDHIRLVLDPASAAMTSLVLRRDGSDVVDLIEPGVSRAAVVEDTSDTWGHRLLAYHDEIGRFEPTSVELVEAGPVRAIIRVNARYGDSTVVEDFVVWAHGREVELRVMLDWREKGKLLKLRFPTRLTDTNAAFEIPYGVVEREPDGEEEPAQRWVDVSGSVPSTADRYGLAVINTGKYGFDIEGGDVGVTAVRSPIYAHHEPTAPTPGVRYQFQDQGPQRFALHLLPHQGAWSDAALSRRAAEVNRRPVALFESGHRGALPPVASYASLEPDHVALGALKVAEDGEAVVVRIVETAGRAASAIVRLPLLDAEVRVDIGPFEIRTFRIGRSGGAVIETDLLERPIGG